MMFVKYLRLASVSAIAALLILPVLLVSSDTKENDDLAGAMFCGFDHDGMKSISIPGIVDVCLHPDTDREAAEEILRNLPPFNEILSSGKVRYNLSNRWVNTANGSTGSIGDPMILTWSFVPDGTWADGGLSTLYADFTAQWGGGTAWVNKIQNAFARWDWVDGITYIEVSDDGANLPASPGILGTRGDCRISGRSIDGSGNVLAYNFYPDGGDMVIDTDDSPYFYNPSGNYATLKNVIMHEHGHGKGLSHVIPEDCTKLMEAYACPSYSFIGPQDDDIRGAQRYYGDIYENNDSLAQSCDLDTIGVAADTIFLDYAAVERGSDLDWYMFTADGQLNVEVDPIGSAYMIGNQYGTASYSRTDSISDPDFCLYDNTGTIMDSVYAMGEAETEVLYNRTLPYNGTYYLKVFRKGGTGNNIQRYEVTLWTGDTGVDVAEADRAPARNLDVRVAPNPFNPLTTAKFYAPKAGPYSVEIFDVSGRLARRIEGNASSAGSVEVQWDGRDENGTSVSSGVYMMRVSAADQVETKRAILVR